MMASLQILSVSHAVAAGNEQSGSDKAQQAQSTKPSAKPETKPIPRAPNKKPPWHKLKGGQVTPSEADAYFKARQEQLDQEKANKKSKQEKAANSNNPNGG